MTIMPNTKNLAKSIRTAARSVLSVAPEVLDVERADQVLSEAATAAKRGYFTPQEDEQLRIVFAKYLLARNVLHEAVNELIPFAFEESVPSPLREQAFLVGYAAGTLLVNSATFILEHAQQSPVLKEKLDEAEPRFGIPRKKFTHIYESLSSPTNLIAMHKSQKFIRSHADELRKLATSDTLQKVVTLLENNPIRYPGLTGGILARIRYRWYSLLRRNISGYRQAFFAVLEGSGRVISELENPLHEKLLTPEIQAEIHSHLQPGDLFVTRHHQAVSNLFLPGFWPHAALYIGTLENRQQLGISCSEEILKRCSGEIEVLEAKKDGVLFRPLKETFHVDCVSIIRPQLNQEQLRECIESVLTHEGKLYDFSFDFTRADRMVCTEVIYRAYEGVGPIQLPLTERAGRLTLSAEDLLQQAVKNDGFDVVGVFGIGPATTHPIFGEQARTLVQDSLAPAT